MCVSQVPLDAVDLQHVSLLYTQGEMAAVAPIYDYDFRILSEIVSEASWRQLLFWLGPPGIVIGLLALMTLKEPRTAKANGQTKPFLGGRLRLPFMSGVPPETSPSGSLTCFAHMQCLMHQSPMSGLTSLCCDQPLSLYPGSFVAYLALLAKVKTMVSAHYILQYSMPFSYSVPPLDHHTLWHAAEPPQAKPASKLAKKAKSIKERRTLSAVRTLLGSRSFQAITFASALNDVGSWALVSWHATFYTRTFGIGPDIYAPMLAAIIPIGGIIGGVGSGLMGDWLSRTGNRHWLTSGAFLVLFSASLMCCCCSCRCLLCFLLLRLCSLTLLAALAHAQRRTSALLTVVKYASRQ